MSVQPIAQQEQQDAAKKVMQARKQQADASKDQVVIPFVETGGEPLPGSAGSIGGFGNQNTEPAESAKPHGSTESGGGKQKD